MGRDARRGARRAAFVLVAGGVVAVIAGLTRRHLEEDAAVLGATFTAEGGLVELGAARGSGGS